MIHPNPVMIQISLDHMQHKIVHAFGPFCDELEQNVDQAVKDAIENFDFHTEVRRQATRILSDAIEQSIRSAFSEIRFDQSARKAMAGMMAKGLAKMANNESEDE